MKTLLARISHNFIALTFGLVMVVAPMLTFLAPRTAQANGETYTWTGDSVTVTGGNTRGDFPNGVTLNRLLAQSGNNLPGATQTYIGPLWYNYNGAGCILQVSLSLISGNQGTVGGAPPQLGYVDPKNCPKAAYGTFSNATVSIQGSPPGSNGNTESQAQKEVDVDIIAPVVFGQAPNSVTITIKDANGNTVQGPIAVNKHDNGSLGGFNDPVSIHEANYPTTFTLDPGSYQVCASYVITTCQPFTKVKGQPLQLSYGGNPNQQVINTTVTFDYQYDGSQGDIASNQVVFGPYTVALEDSSGKDLGNQVQTNTYNPTVAAGAFTTGVKGSVTLSATTPGVAPGTYKICLTDFTNECATVTKAADKAGTANIHLSSADAQLATTAAVTGQPVGQGSGKPDCESTADNNGWLLCPIFNGLSNFTAWIYNNILQPFLYTDPISTSASDSSFQIWSTFRVYGDIFLVIALLIIVFGESIGGGFIDAYTAKKALPRVLAAAILINLSVYIVAFMVDATNILGATLGHIITAPIDLSFQPSATAGDVAIAGGVLGLILSAGGIAVVAIGIFATHGALLTSALYVAFFAMLPIFLAIAVIFMVLIIRKGIILALILISPVAFALYCLPSTERWFRRWWETLFGTLLIYPAIAAFYAVIDVLSVSILKANGVAASNIKNGNAFNSGSMHGPILPHIASVLGVHAGTFADTTQQAGVTTTILVIIAVIFLEGGGKVFIVIWVVRNVDKGIAAIERAGKGGATGFNKLFDNKRKLSQARLHGQMVQSRENAYRKAGNLSNSGNAFVRFAGRRLQNRIQGGGLRDVLGESAAYRAEQMKIAEAINSTGDDTQLRALSVNKRWALSHGVEGVDWRRSANGGREFRTLAGNKWIGEGDVDAAHTRWGTNQAMKQWSLGHEMSKATTQEDQDYLRNNFKNMQYGTGMTDGEMTGMWTGAAYAKQNENRQWKHYAWNGNDKDLRMNGLGMMREIDEKQGSYQMSMQNADTWTTMAQEMKNARQTITEHQYKLQQARIGAGPKVTAEEHERSLAAQETLQRGARIADSVRAASVGGGIPVGGEGDEAAARAAMAGPPGVDRNVGAGAAGRVRQEMNNFVNFADQYAGRYNLPTAGTPNTPIPREPMDETLDTRAGNGRRS